MNSTDKSINESIYTTENYRKYYVYVKKIHRAGCCESHSSWMNKIYLSISSLYSTIWSLLSIRSMLLKYYFFSQDLYSGHGFATLVNYHYVLFFLQLFDFCYNTCLL